MKLKRWPWPVQGSVVAALAAVVVACAAEPTPEELEADANLDGPNHAIYRRAAEGTLVPRRRSRVLEVPSTESMPKLLPRRLRLQDESLPGEAALQPMDQLARRVAVMSPPGASGPEADGAEETSGIDPGPNRHPVLTITKDGSIYLNRLRVEKENLEEAIRAELSRSGTDTLLLRGDRRAATMGLAMDIMGIAKKAGARNIGILTERNPEMLHDEVPGTAHGPGTPRRDAAAARMPTGSRQPPESPDGQPPAASVRGSLEAIIRGVIREHLHEIKACYEAQLAHTPGLAGRAMVQFTIAATGQVVASALASSTLGNVKVEACLVRAVRAWKFPEPEGGGIVIVTYPFSFTPSGSEAAAAPSKPRPHSGRQNGLPVTHVFRVVRACRCPRSRAATNATCARAVHPAELIDFNWTIDRSGGVSKVHTTRDDLNMPETTACITELNRQVYVSHLHRGALWRWRSPSVFQSSEP